MMTAALRLRIVVFGLVALSLCGCETGNPLTTAGAMRIEVEVYKGPLSKEPAVQWGELTGLVDEAGVSLVSVGDRIVATAAAEGAWTRKPSEKSQTDVKVDPHYWSDRVGAAAPNDREFDNASDLNRRSSNTRTIDMKDGGKANGEAWCSRSAYDSGSISVVSNKLNECLILAQLHDDVRLSSGRLTALRVAYQTKFDPDALVQILAQLERRLYYRQSQFEVPESAVAEHQCELKNQSRYEFQCKYRSLQNFIGETVPHAREFANLRFALGENMEKSTEPTVQANSEADRPVEVGVRNISTEAADSGLEVIYRALNKQCSTFDDKNNSLLPTPLPTPRGDSLRNSATGCLVQRIFHLRVQAGELMRLTVDAKAKALGEAKALEVAKALVAVAKANVYADNESFLNAILADLKTASLLAAQIQFRFNEVAQVTSELKKKTDREAVAAILSRQKPEAADAISLKRKLVHFLLTPGTQSPTDVQRILEETARVANELKMKALGWQHTHTASPPGRPVRNVMVSFATWAAEYSNLLSSRADALLKQMGPAPGDRREMPLSVLLRDTQLTDFTNLWTWNRATSTPIWEEYVLNTLDAFNSNESANRVRILEKLFEDHNWSKINTVYASGQGKTSVALIKDDIGNWNLKSFDSDPGDLLDAYKNLTLAGVDLARKALSNAIAPGAPSNAKYALDLAGQLTRGKLSTGNVAGGLDIARLHDRTKERLDQAISTGKSAYDAAGKENDAPALQAEVMKGLQAKLREILESHEIVLQALQEAAVENAKPNPAGSIPRP